MTDRYADIRAALDSAQELGENCFLTLNSAEIRALLAERDALRAALQGLLDALPSATAHPAIQAARAALAQEQGENHDNQD